MFLGATRNARGNIKAPLHASAVKGEPFTDIMLQINIRYPLIILVFFKPSPSWKQTFNVHFTDLRIRGDLRTHPEEAPMPLADND
jgi:hypothetical protein